MTPKGITAEVVGGLGNQIFIYAAALEQAKRLSVPVYVDKSWFKEQEKRNFCLEQLFDFEDAKNGPFQSFFRKAKVRDTLYKESSPFYQSDIDKITPGTTISGYFQSTRYFENVADDVVNGILTARVSPREQAAMDEILSLGSFNAIHVRRGDYAHDPHTRAYHGLTSVEYFKRSLGAMPAAKRTIVFSDSPEEVSSELADVVGLDFPAKLSELGEVATLRLLASAENLAISNSSFSWWAAFCATSMNPNATIVSPRPWSSQIYFNQDLILPTWFSLGIQ